MYGASLKCASYRKLLKWISRMEVQDSGFSNACFVAPTWENNSFLTLLLLTKKVTQLAASIK